MDLVTLGSIEEDETKFGVCSSNFRTTAGFMPPIQYSGYDPQLVTEWVGFESRVDGNGEQVKSAGENKRPSDETVAMVTRKRLQSDWRTSPPISSRN
ncbi:hypothetical protein TNCV_2321601 [Trichonephila clavipes]|nr:hypothetical protein TNCV_2321601 [Trichonephila clavipes]